MDAKEFRNLGHQVVDLLADYLHLPVRFLPITCRFAQELMQTAGREDAAPRCPELLREMARRVRELDNLLPEGPLGEERAKEEGEVCGKVHGKLVTLYSRLG